MKNEDVLLKRLMMILVGSGMNDEQIADIVITLRSTRVSQALEITRDIRDAVFLNNFGGTLISSEKIDIQNERVAFASTDAVGSIERLVVREAGLPKAVAAGFISSALKKRNPLAEIPRFNAKEGFAKWLQHVAEVVNLSEILHVAAAISRSNVKDSYSDEWIKEFKSYDSSRKNPNK